MKSLRILCSALHVAILLCLSYLSLQAQNSFVEIDRLDSVFGQDFDSLTKSCDNSITSLTGWSSTYNANDVDAVSFYSDGCKSNEFGVFAFNSVTDPSLGIVPDNDSNGEVSLLLKNTSNKVVRQIGLYFTGEQWYKGNSNYDALNVSVGTGQTVETLVFDADNTLVFEALDVCGNGNKKCKGELSNVDGNNANYQTNVQAFFQLKNELLPNEFVKIKWQYNTSDDGQVHHGLALDEVGVMFQNTDVDTWFFLSTATDPSKVDSWTKWPNDQQSAGGVLVSGKNGISNENSKFIVNHAIDFKSDFKFTGNNIEVEFNADVQLNKSALMLLGDENILKINGNCSTDSEVEVSGENSKLIVNDNKSLDVFKKGNETFIAHVTVKENASLNYFRDVKKVSGFTIDSCYDKSIVFFDNLSSANDKQFLPSASYYILRVDDSSGKLKRDIITQGPIVVRKEFSFYPADDLFTDDFGFTFVGDSNIINMPNYSGEGIFKSLEIAENANLYFGDLFNDKFYNNHIIVDAPFVINNQAQCFVRENQSLILDGAHSFDHSGVLHVENNASLILDDETLASGEGLTYITRNQPFPNSTVFNHWSSPVKGANIGRGGEINGHYNYYYLNGEQANSDYRKFSSLRSMQVGRGYSSIGNTSSLFTANGVDELNFGTVSYTALEEEDGDYDSENFYLVGNPFTSSISAVQFLEDNSKEIMGTVYLFSQVNEFGTYSRSGDNIAVNILGASDYGTQTDSVFNATNFEDFTIASGQGFFVIDKTPESARIDINFTREMQSGVNNNFKSKSINKHQYWVVLKDDKTYASSLLVYSENVNEAWDAPKIPHLIDNGMAVWTTKDDRALAIQARSLKDTMDYVIPIGLNVSSPGNYQLNLKTKNPLLSIDFLLYDRELNLFHEIEEGDYSFAVHQLESVKQRFALVPKRNEVLEQLDVVTQTECNNHTLESISNSMAETNDAFTFYDANGLLIDDLNSKNKEALKTALPKGLTIIEVAKQNGTTCVYKFWKD
tara:strand:- start:12552 stop:15587 length:3036 start_codon:yes stop_codon:yes gene_type:complete